ncbi:hypothetical protein [Sphingobacterium sp. LRF_L2]|uniref:hypothetical protein n=1 Tax=Sphingobacterium sp. LRF_L2 TaxID=3369421 RepID=UPI003F62D64C
MEISKALLEKYELGLCNDQEIAAVQKWLENDNWDDFPTENASQDIKNEIWSDLSNYISPKAEIAKAKINWRKFLFPVYTSAACLIAFFLLKSLFTINQQSETEFFNKNDSHETLGWLHKKNFDLLLSENSSAQISLKNKSITLSGDIMFKPKQDFTLEDKKTKAIFHFKKGQVYVLSESQTEHKLIVFKENELAFLPPAIQRKLKKQFQIS